MNKTILTIIILSLGLNVFLWMKQPSAEKGVSQQTYQQMIDSKEKEIKSLKFEVAHQESESKEKDKASETVAITNYLRLYYNYQKETYPQNVEKLKEVTTDSYYKQIQEQFLEVDGDSSISKQTIYLSDGSCLVDLVLKTVFEGNVSRDSVHLLIRLEMNGDKVASSTVLATYKG